MCGISGIIQLKGFTDCSEDVRKMNHAQRHRGPDGNGIYQSAPVSFGHVRLSIIDLSNGAQPFVDAEEQIVLTYNGEVYNYKELKNELADDFAFQTDCDTEVVSKSYQKWGINCLQKFRGMFAFALFDKRKQVVFLVRDRLGIKPLYYYQDENQIVFCSELQALMSSGRVPRDIEASSIVSYLKYQYIPTPASIYRKVKKLPPAHILKIDIRNHKIDLYPYWELSATAPLQSKRQEEWAEELNALVDDSVSLYCRADVPFGSFLSGGVDSTLVTGAMSKCLSKPVHTFSIGFREQQHCELVYAREASEKLQTLRHESVVSPTIDEDFLGMLAHHFGEPFADSSAIPTYFVSKETSPYVKMILSGDGGDELFAGYDSYRSIFETNQKPFGYKALCQLLTFAPTWNKWLTRVQKNASQRVLRYEKLYDTFRQIFSNGEAAALMNQKHQCFPERLYQKKWDLDEISHFQRLDLATYLHDDVLTKVDRMSMAHSLEVRVPLLDHELVEFAFKMPLDFKIRKQGDQVITKHILKQSASRFIGMDFLNRPKQGFGIPLTEWCQGHLRGLIEGSLRNPSNPIYEWLNFKQTNALLSSFFQGNSLLASRLWTILMLDIWLRKVHFAN